MDLIYKLDRVGYNYIKDYTALIDITFDIKEKEIISIIGSNGSGKSTLMQLLSGLIFPQKGNLYFYNELLDANRFKDPQFNAFFRSKVGVIFQHVEAQLFCPTVKDELLFGPLQLSLPVAESMQRVEEVSQMLHINHLLNRPGYMLSGGEQKKVAIGAVLTANPQIIIFDEPLSGLDPKNRAFIIEIIFELHQEGKTIILATHHLELVNILNTRVVVLSPEHTVAKVGTCEEILLDTQLLIKNNLISEYLHKHPNIVNKHVYSYYQPHEHKK